LTPLVWAILAPRHNLATPFPWTMQGKPKTRLDRDSGVTGWVHHDLRRTWATVSAEQLTTSPHIIEAVLAHQSGTRVARTYNRALYIEPMRKAMIAYEEWLQALLATSEGTND
jgi:integrase